MMALRIDHLVTADLPDGQSLPPYLESNAIWHVVRRLPDGRTSWRRICLSEGTSPSDALDGRNTIERLP